MMRDPSHGMVGRSHSCQASVRPSADHDGIPGEVGVRDAVAARRRRRAATTATSQASSRSSANATRRRPGRPRARRRGRRARAPAPRRRSTGIATQAAVGGRVDERRRRPPSSTRRRRTPRRPVTGTLGGDRDRGRATRRPARPRDRPGRRTPRARPGGARRATSGPRPRSGTGPRPRAPRSRGLTGGARLRGSPTGIAIADRHFRPIERVCETCRLMPPQPESLRIAWLVYRGNPHCGGQGVYTRYLARELTELGHHVDGALGPALPRARRPRAAREGPEPRPLPARATRSGCRGRGSSGTAIDLQEFAIMCAAGFPEPYTFSLRARHLLARPPRRLRPHPRQPVPRHRACSG